MRPPRPAAHIFEVDMDSPDQLRAKAAKAREVAGSKNRSPNGYLLDLADRYEAEATEIERRRPAVERRS
jgi:hypothetical protein